MPMNSPRWVPLNLTGVLTREVVLLHESGRVSGSFDLMVGRCWGFEVDVERAAPASAWCGRIWLKSCR